MDFSKRSPPVGEVARASPGPTSAPRASRVSCEVDTSVACLPEHAPWTTRVAFRVLAEPRLGLKSNNAGARSDDEDRRWSVSRSALFPATMPLASAPGSEAFYRRSMRKGAGGDVEGEAMRANLTFQNSLRAETPPPR